MAKPTIIEGSVVNDEDQESYTILVHARRYVEKGGGCAVSGYVIKAADLAAALDIAIAQGLANMSLEDGYHSHYCFRANFVEVEG